MFFFYSINNNLAYGLHLNKTSFFSVSILSELWSQYLIMFYLFDDDDDDDDG